MGTAAIALSWLATVAFPPQATGSPPPRAGSQESAPKEIALGSSAAFAPVAGERGVAFRLVIQKVEPITVSAISFDCDVRVQVETSDGAVLAHADDGGIETDARLIWTPKAPGPVLVRVQTEAPAGIARVDVFRSALPLQLRDPAFAARAYWETAWALAKQRDDRPRMKRALSECAALLRRPEAAVERDLLAALDAMRESMVQFNLANARMKADDRAGARAALRACASTLVGPRLAERAILGNAHETIAALACSLADFDVAKMVEEPMLTLFERAESAEYPELQRARHFLAVTLERQGEFSRARELMEEAVAIQQRALPEADPSLLQSRSSLADILREQGELERARSIQDDVLKIALRVMPEESWLVQMARTNLATTMSEQGDDPGARPLFERALELFEPRVSPDDQDLQVLRNDLAVILKHEGDLPGARRLFQKVLEVREKSLKENDLDLQLSRIQLALVMSMQGHPTEARQLAQKALASESRLPDDHPKLQAARWAVARTMYDEGDFAGARALTQKVVKAFERTLPKESPDFQNARCGHAWNCARLKDDVELSTTLRALAESGIAGLVQRRSDSERERETDAASEQSQVETLWSLLPYARESDRSSLRKLLFDWIEARRAVADHAELGALTAGEMARIKPLQDEVAASREPMARLVAGMAESPPDDTAAEAFLAEQKRARDELPRAVARRDDAERALNRLLEGCGAIPPEIRVESLARSLPPASAVVSYFTGTRARPDVPEDLSRSWTPREELVAFVVTADGRLEQVDLGGLEPIRQMTSDWRSLIDTPIDRGALPVARTGPDQVVELGFRLRAALLDPVLKAAGEVKTLFVCLDSVLHLLPLEALPGPAGSVVGDHLDLRFETSFSRLIATASPRRKADAASTGTALLVGAVDFDAAAGPDGPGSPSAPEETPVNVERSGPGGTVFAPLTETKYETDAVAEYFERTFHEKPVVLQRERATKAAFAENAPRARYIHLATHGYFSTAAVTWRGEPPRKIGPDALWTPQSLEDRVMGMSPMTLCGLALAGANHGRDATGRVPGIITAEELGGLDLSRCELAVLSACETNVGIDRAGLGIESLQKALHMAGARTAITSLWRVDDARARELMTEFYRLLWIEKRPKASALWEAKRLLRRNGASLKDWAGWILTGDPGS